MHGTHYARSLACSSHRKSQRKHSRRQSRTRQRRRRGASSLFTYCKPDTNLRPCPSKPPLPWRQHPEVISFILCILQTLIQRSMFQQSWATDFTMIKSKSPRRSVHGNMGNITYLKILMKYSFFRGRGAGRSIKFVWILWALQRMQLR